MANVLIDQGTQSAIATDTVGTVNYQVVKLDVGSSGNSTPFTGGVVVTAGTVSAGTINTGTINAGTIKQDGRPGRNILSYGTTFAGTAAAYGTLVGSAVVGVGTSTWVSSLSIINSGTTSLTSVVGFGTALNGTSIIGKGSFGTQGGIQKEFPLATNAGMTNQDLVCYISAAGTIDVNVTYFISA
jgi:hypothetical protein